MKELKGLVYWSSSQNHVLCNFRSDVGRFTQFQAGFSVLARE